MKMTKPKHQTTRTQIKPNKQGDEPKINKTKPTNNKPNNKNKQNKGKTNYNKETKIELQPNIEAPKSKKRCDKINIGEENQEASDLYLYRRRLKRINSI